MTLEVMCGKNVIGDEIPQEIVIDGRRIVILRIVDQWLSFDHQYFKIYGDDGGLYILRHEVETDFWELTLLEQLRNF